jgi:hypothetical protein
MAIKIKGQVVNRTSRKPVGNAGIEALIKVREDAATFAKTDSDPEGCFNVGLEEREWEQFLATDREAFVYFRVFLAGKTDPIADTRDTLPWKPGTTNPDAGRAIPLWKILFNWLVNWLGLASTSGDIRIEIDALQTALESAVEDNIVSALSLHNLERSGPPILACLTWRLSPSSSSRPTWPEISKNGASVHWETSAQRGGWAS